MQLGISAIKIKYNYFPFVLFSQNNYHSSDDFIKHASILLEFDKQFKTSNK